MKLKELMPQIDKGVRIGTDRGQSGFVYCGHSKNCDLVTLDRTVFAKKCTYIISRKDDIRALQEKLKHPHKRYSEYYKRSKGKFKEGKPMQFEEWKAFISSELVRAEANMNSAIDSLMQYQSFRDREVVDVYASISQPDTDIIIVDGDEAGDYWDEEEYNRRANDEE